MPKVSIIIPCKQVDKYAIECVRRCLELDYPSYEIILLPDHKPGQSIPGAKVIPTGPATPGAKRNIGAANAAGEILAYIDADAYPPRDWLRKAVKHLAGGKTAAVGGPGITPPHDTPMQKASGYTYAAAAFPSSIAGRFKTGKPRETDDIHSCNLVAHRKIVEEVGGWDEKYWPGEDTLLCQAIRKAGYRILQAPDVIVYHHRKPLYRKHLSQAAQFGLHRGHFARKYRGNSLKPQYALPALITILLTGGLPAALLAGGALQALYAAAAALYLLAALAASILETREKRLVPIVWAGVILTHLAYGLHYMAGLLKKDLKR